MKKLLINLMIIILVSLSFNISVSVSAKSITPLVHFEKLSATGKCGDNVEWLFDENTKTLTISGTGKMYDYGYTEIKSGGKVYYTLNSPFAFSKNIETLIIEEGIEYISDYTFYYISAKKAELPNTLLEIGDCAFFSQYLEDIQLPDNVQTIGECAFAETKIKSINIPKSVVKMPVSNFNSYKLEEINVDEDNKIYSSIDGVLFNKNKTKLLIYPRNKKGEYIVPDGVKVIARGAFDHVQKLKTISFSDSVEKIYKEAFIFTDCLRNIKKYSKNLRYIGEGAFAFCDGLKEFRIGKNVSCIKKSAFEYCDNLKNFYVSGKNEKYCSVKGVIFTKNKKALVMFPSGRKGKYTVPEQVKSIGKSAFETASIKSVILNNSLKTIGDRAFSYSNITKITIPGSVKTIGKSAFETASIKSVVLNNGLKTIGDSAFAGSSITKITIPRSVKSIGKSAFKTALELEKIVFERKDKLPEMYPSTFSSDFPKDPTNFYVQKKSLAKSLKKKLKNSGLKSVNIYYKADDGWNKF